MEAKHTPFHQVIHENARLKTLNAELIEALETLNNKTRIYIHNKTIGTYSDLLEWQEFVNELIQKAKGGE